MQESIGGADILMNRLLAKPKTPARSTAAIERNRIHHWTPIGSFERNGDVTTTISATFGSLRFADKHTPAALSFLLGVPHKILWK